LDEKFPTASEKMPANYGGGVIHTVYCYLAVKFFAALQFGKLWFYVVDCWGFVMFA